MRNAPVVGIDLGGTNMQIGVVLDDGRIVGRCKRKTKATQGLEAVVARMVEGVQRAAADAGMSMGELSAVGVGVPGAIDVPRGVVHEAPNLQWFDVPIRDLLSTALKVPVAVDNDVNVAVWGESKRGAGRTCGAHGGPASDLLGIWVGTGVGGGLVLEDKLWRGPFFTAGEIGQTIVSPDGGPAKRTLEQHASRTGIVHNLELLLIQHPDSMLHALRAENDDVIGSKQIAEAYAAHDRAAVEVVEHAARMLGASIANVVTLLSIGAVVVGGGVTEALGQPFVDLIKTNFDRFVFPGRLRSTALVMTELRDDAGVHGAALLARDVASSSEPRAPARGVSPND